MGTSASLLVFLRTSLDGASRRCIDELNRPPIRNWLRTVADNRLGTFYRLRENRPTSLSHAMEDSPLMQLADSISELGGR